MKEIYPIVITPAGSDYVVYIPDFDINTEGKSVADAISMARDAIGIMGIDYQDNNKVLPIPSQLAALNPADSDICTLVDIDFDEYRRKNDMRSVKKNCTIPSWLCYAAEKEHINFSQALQDGLKARLGLT